MAQLQIIDQTRAQLDAPNSAVTPRAPTPQVQYVGIEAQARYQETLGQTLDRISAKVFNIAGDYAKEAGLQYAAENPLTQEQLQAIVNGDVSKVVTTGTSINIYSNAVRKARAFEVSGHAEIEARNEMAKLLPGIDSGKVTADDVKTAISTLTTGYSKALTQIDPEASLKFRATVGAIGNTYIEKAATAEIRRRRAENEIKLETSYQALKRELEEVFGRENWPVTAQGIPITANQLSDALRDNFITNATLIAGADMAKKYADSWERDVAQAKINAVTKFVTNDTNMTDPQATYERLRRGDAGALTVVYQSLGQDDKAKVMGNLMGVVANRASIARVQREEDERVKKDQALDLFEKWLDPRTSEAQKRTLRTEMLSLNVLSFDQTKSLFENTGANPGVVFKFEDMIDNGQITNSTDLMAQGTRAGLSGQQLVDLRRRMSTKVGAEEKTLYRQLIGVVGDGPVIINKGSSEAKAQQKLDDYLANAQAKAQAENKPFIRLDALKQFRTEQVQRMNSEDAKAARRSLEPYEKKAGGKITSATLPMLEQQVNSKKVDIKPRELDQIRRLVNRAEGNE